MKKIVTTIFALMIFAIAAHAVPAMPGSFKRIQPDGSVITLTVHGDEFFAWYTDASGSVVEKEADGFYRPVPYSAEEHLARLRRASADRRKINDNSIWSSYENPPETNFGDRKVLVILTNFTDSVFTINDPRTRFYNMLNQSGYSENGGRGSVRDFFLENSHNQYRPSFDVYGPVDLSHSSAWYTKNGARNALTEACQLLDGEINFADYDTDKDGTIDMVLFYYPGHNPAEGGADKNEAIWPHKSTAYGTFDGVKLGNYFCTSEKRSTIDEMCGIGTTTHEFSHSLGLPDTYDTDYEQNGGENGTTEWYDIMASGPYLMDGKCPPYFNAIERNMLGWMSYPTLLTESGQKSLAPIQEDAAFRLDSDNEEEFFILEYRNGEGWDAGLPDNGLLIYHVDQSNNELQLDINNGYGLYNYTASYLWNYTNNLNCLYGHPCFYIMTDTGGLPGSFSWTNMALGGNTSNVTSFNYFQTWDGSFIGLKIDQFDRTSSSFKFRAAVTNQRFFSGTVTDTSLKPIAGAQVVLSQAAYDFNAAPSLLPTDLAGYTDENGYFIIELPQAQNNYMLSIRKEGYVPYAENLTLEESGTVRDYSLFRVGEGTEEALYKRNTAGTIYSFSFGAIDMAVGMVYTAEEIESQGLAGATINTIVAGVYNIDFESLYVVVQFGTERVLTKKQNSVNASSYNKYDITEDNVVIPSGKDVFIGFGLSGVAGTQGKSPLFIQQCTGSSNGGNYYIPNFLSSETMYQLSGSELGDDENDYDFLVHAFVTTAIEDDLSDHGIAYVDLENGVPTVNPPAGKTVKDATWSLDGTPVDTPPATSSLGSGAHTYKVVLRYYDGTSETLWYDVIK